ncbi:U2 snRNP complex subunit [Tulasnella sp. 424]|nr:U2 snRNP complex subunit [Tulasnella sp. 424]KAG8981240.1 U2 snRNP complex subunit [Tulasnella sp. 425]
MKLTPELIASSPSYINPLKDRELDLRGHKIPTIENLGVTRDQHDTIDLTDNSVSQLQNFPLLKRLSTLLVSNNRVAHISPTLAKSIPNLTSLCLTNNAVSELGDLVPLGELKQLEYLSLVGNPVREKKYYREWLIFNCKSLRVLDYQRIQDKERKSAKTLFLTPDNLPTALATSLTAAKAVPSKGAATTEEEPAGPAGAALGAGKAGRMMTAEERERVKAAILKATTAEEVRRLEKTLREGWSEAVNLYIQYITSTSSSSLWSSRDIQHEQRFERIVSPCYHKLVIAFGYRPCVALYTPPSNKDKIIMVIATFHGPKPGPVSPRLLLSSPIIFLVVCLSSYEHRPEFKPGSKRSPEWSFERVRADFIFQW